MPLPDDYDLSAEDMEFLTQASAAQRETNAGWFQRYGFTHDCRCDKDYIEGNVETVPACWCGMAEDALNMCAFYRGALVQIGAGMDDPAGFAETVVTRDHLADFKAREEADDE